jgi:L-asparagine oxygenase
VLTAVKQDGFALQKALAPSLATIEVAQALGAVIDIRGVLPSSGIPTVQSLRPRNADEVGQNRYSGHYGLGTFPLHTDLAYWNLPPRYLLLRCIAGSNDVFTNILPWSRVVELIGTDVLRRAVFTARNRRIGYSGLVRSLSYHHEAELFRWDPIFLWALNQQARALGCVMLDPRWDTVAAKVLLHHPGDTLIIDNWQVLHGRSQILTQGTVRHLERVYLSEVFQ